MENPFQFGRELGAGELVNREDEITQVAATIREGGKLFLIGPRRYGKTSILKAAEERLSGEGAVVLRCDAEIYPSLDLLVAAIISRAAQNLKGSVERTGEHIGRFFAKLRPEATFSVTDREWTVKLGVTSAEDAGKHIELLVEALDGMENLAKAQPIDNYII
jgi:AAA+ ATPase superfamily predicted ATPase